MFYSILSILSIIIIVNLTSIIAYPITSLELVEPLEPLGSNKCTWGPSYWCASPENALECNFDYNECKKYTNQVEDR